MNEQGFTFIEIMIAVTISAVILLAVFIFLNQGINTWERSSEINEWEQNWRVLKKNIEKDLHNLFYSDLYNDNLFTADYQGVKWIVEDDNYLKEVYYYLDHYSGSIIREEKPHQSEEYTIKDSKEAQEKTEIVFFEDFRIDRIDFYFYDPQNNYWDNSWSIKDKVYLPTIVRVDLEISTEQLPSILVEVYIGRSFKGSL